MRPHDATGIVEEAAARRAYFAAHIYRAPVILESSRRPMSEQPTPQAIALMNEVADIMVRRYPKLKKRPIGGVGERVRSVVAEVSGIPVGVLRGAGHRWEVSHARFLAYWLMKQLQPRMSTTVMGRLMGTELRPKDHTTVMHGLKRFEVLRETPRFQGWLSDSRIVALLEKPVDGGVGR